MNMKLIYVTNGRIPTEKAYGLQTVSMCQAFVGAGAPVTLVIPRRKNSIAESLFDYYGVEKNFGVSYIPIIDAIGWGRRFGFWVTRLSYAVALLFSLKLRKQPDTVIFTRDLIAAVLLKLRGHRVFYDMHGFPYKFLWFWKKACQMMEGMVCTNQWKIEQCKKIFKIHESKLCLARNGFTNDQASSQTLSTARREVALPPDKEVVVYAGHLQDWKGVDVLAKAAQKLSNILFVFVGGTADEITRFKARNLPLSKNVVMKGQRPHQEIPTYLQAADVVVLPNSARSENFRFAVYSQYDTSPLKLFEYMASRRPIVASALPSIKEILNESNAVLVEPDNPNALVDGIRKVLSNPDLKAKLETRAWQDVQQYSWANRAFSILDFIESQKV